MTRTVNRRQAVAALVTLPFLGLQQAEPTEPICEPGPMGATWPDVAASIAEWEVSANKHNLRLKRKEYSYTRIIRWRPGVFCLYGFGPPDDQRADLRRLRKLKDRFKLLIIGVGLAADGWGFAVLIHVPDDLDNFSPLPTTRGNDIRARLSRLWNRGREPGMASCGREARHA